MLSALMQASTKDDDKEAGGKDLRVRGNGEASGDLPSQTIKMHEEEQILESGGIKEMDVDDTSRRKTL